MESQGTLLLNPEFVKGTSENLPKVYFDMFLEFIIENKCYDKDLMNKLRRKKTKVWFEREDPSYIQLKREGPRCVLMGSIDSKYPPGYADILLIIDENNQKVLSGGCSECKINVDGGKTNLFPLDETLGCRHLARLLKWLNDKTEDESIKPLTTYWKTDRQSIINDEDFELSPEVAQCSFYFVSLNFNSCDLISRFNFLDYVKKTLTPEVCEEIERETRSQTKNPLWHELRYGRITASTLYQASCCKTPNGSLNETLMTLAPTADKETKPMRRGRELEIYVLEALQKRIKKTVRPSGLILNKKYPIFGASPDGIGSDFVVEIKCPFAESSIERYYKDGNIQPRYKAQIQLQMLLSNRNYGYFVIADPRFELNKKIRVLRKEYFDCDFISLVLRKAEIYWQNHVFPKLIQTI